MRVKTDSQYLRRGVTEWLAGWIARGWKRQGGVLLNEDLWRRLAAAITLHEITWEWVKGHSGQRYNERADELATQGIREQTAKIPAARPAPGGAAAVGEPPPVDTEIFLRVSAAGAKGGWAALVRHAGEERVLSRGEPRKSANQLDLMGLLAALESVPKGRSIAIHTGSDYLRNGAMSWLAGWKRRAWKTQDGQPVQNRELWQRLDAALAAHRVQWPSVKERPVPELEALATTAREAAARGE